jgi:hypothetical protein
LTKAANWCYDLSDSSAMQLAVIVNAKDFGAVTVASVDSF